MAVDIYEHSDDKIYVNDKLVYLDQDNNWIAKVELTKEETEELNNHIRAK